jgi:propanol-preferring alcohol dehydrogenase
MTKAHLPPEQILPPGMPEKRRSRRILLRINVVVRGRDRTGEPFQEQTHTLVVNAHGALLELRAGVKEGQTVVLRNRASGEEAECRVVWHREVEGGKHHVGLEFVTPSPRFWRVEFPSDDWNVMMRAALLRGFGQPLAVEEVPRPIPRADEVLVRVEACGVCHSDLHMAHGDWPATAAAMHLPAILGHEVVGQVVEQGAEVSTPRIGDRVGVGWLYSVCGVCELCMSGAENLCLERKVTGVAAPGGCAEYIRIRAAQAIPVPAELQAEQAAPLFCAGLTVFHACWNAGIRSGQRVAVFGAGGLGHLAIQMARNSGAEVIAVDVHAEKLQLARKLGATTTLLADDPMIDIYLTQKGGPDVALVTATSKSAYDLAFRTLRRRGTLAVVGLPKEDLTFFADDLVVKEPKIVGAAVGTREEMRAVLALAAAGKFRCHVEVFGLEQINLVYERLARGEILGRAVIRM